MLGRLKEIPVVTLEGIAIGSSLERWAEATSIACDFGNVYVTTASAGGISPYKKWNGRPFTPSGFQLFSTLGLLR